MMPRVRTMMSMVPVPIATAMVPRMLAVFAISPRLVARLIELFPHGGPFVIAQLAIVVAVEAGEQDVAQGIAAEAMSRTGVTARTAMMRWTVMPAGAIRSVLLIFFLVLALGFAFVLVTAVLVFFVLLFAFVFGHFTSGSLALFLGRIIVGPSWQ